MRSRGVIRQKTGSITPERLSKSTEERDLRQRVKHTPPLALPGNQRRRRQSGKEAKSYAQDQTERSACPGAAEGAGTTRAHNARPHDRIARIMQRYLRYAGVVGKEPIRTVRLTQQGVMRQQPGQQWMPLVAAQSFTTKPAAFLWRSTMRPFPLAWISAKDRFTGGHGSMRIKLLSFITVGNVRGPEMDQGELQRYLAEMIWFPTAGSLMPSSGKPSMPIPCRLLSMSLA
jgi:hypothetical protein